MFSAKHSRVAIGRASNLRPKKKKKEKGKDREKEKKSTGETDSNVCEDAWLFVTRETEEN